MKILSWMQRKLDEKLGTRKQNSISANHHMQKEPQREEFSDWPHGLLAIGTFGYKNLIENPKGCKCNIQGSKPSSHDHLQDITPEEVGELQKELKLLVLHNQVSVESSLAEELETYNLPLDNVTCPLSLDDDRTNSDTKSCGDLADKEDHLKHNSSIVVDKGKDVRLDQTNNAAMGKKSFSFLLKKMFICHSGFAPAPSLRDPLPQSRIEKILRTIILHKKIYPQSSSPKKYLENKYMAEIDNHEDEQIDKANDGNKWVKTDSEYIVLEI